MAITFQLAPTVARGQRITSTQYRKLARAFNDRCRSGIGNMAYRLVMYWYNLFRQVRNPAEGFFLFPSNAEFFDIYQHFDPEHIQGTTWPVAGPGEFEGANLANPMMQFVFGVAPNLDSEDIRINDNFAILPGGSSLEDLWTLGKSQRGAFDPLTGAQATPAFTVAQDFFRIVQPYYSPHGKAYGAFFPTPVELSASCGTTDDTGLTIPSYEIIFTGLRADVSTAGLHGTIGVNGDGLPTVTYAGTCPCWTDDNAADHVLAILPLPFAYYVYVSESAGDCEGALDRLPINDWIEGPYQGAGFLRHTEGQQLHRALGAFITDFRGSASQREGDNFRIKRIAANYEDFFRSQYYLSPQRGTVNGELISAIYPTATWTGPNIAEGTLGDFGGETSHPFTSGFVFAGAFAKATGLTAPVTLQYMSNGQVLAALRLVPDADQNASGIVTIRGAVETPSALTVRVANDVSLASGGTLSTELLELYDYKPNVWDAYLINRVSASQGGIAQTGSGVDGRGLDYTLAREITDSYFQYGALVNPYGVGGVRDIAEWVNDNPVFDAARRMSRSHMRVWRRQQLTAYEVANGKSVCYFKRFAYGLDNIRADMFADIAPPIDPVTALTIGETYIVRSADTLGTVDHANQTFGHNQTFTAQTTEFATHGDALVYIYDGIRHTALRRGFTTEWVMFPQWKCYHPSETSIWKPTAYSDYYAWNDRCHFYSGTAPTTLRKHFNYNYSVELDGDFNPVLNPERVQAVFIAPEAPDAYRYTLGANNTFSSAEFCASCRVYEKPYEIESCVIDDWDNDILKVTFTTRFHSHPDAPATVNKDPSTWSADEIAQLRNEYVTDPAINEDYRTDDNAVREYVLSESNGNYQCTFKTGDAGTGSGVSGLPDNPFGACYPHFFACRLVPEPYEDGNDVQQNHDARCLVDGFQQMEVLLRAGCEGFIDGQTSLDIICDTESGSVFEYTFENLCFEAFGGRWIGLMPVTTREDFPSGFGPLPNTIMDDELFNRLSAAVNLLTRARLDVPIEFNFRTHNYTGSAAVSVTFTSGTSSCSETATTYGYADSISAPVADTFVSTSGWSPWSAVSATQSAQLTGCPFEVVNTRTAAEYKAEIDPNFANAIPAHIQELVDLGQTQFIARYTTSQTNERRETTTDINASEECCLAAQAPCPGKWFDTGPPTIYHNWVPNEDIQTSQCLIVTSGTLESPPLLMCDYEIGRNSDFASGVFCTNGPSSQAQLELIANSDVWVTVELVDTA